MNESADDCSDEFDYQSDFTQVCFIPCSYSNITEYIFLVFLFLQFEALQIFKLHQFSSFCNCNQTALHSKSFFSIFQFLKEARNSSFQVHVNAVVTNEKKIDSEKKQRKSWKKSLFSWLKNDNKSKSLKQLPHTTAPALKARRAHVSGPLGRAVGSGVTTGKARRGDSGPLAGLFGSAGRPGELEVPYMCLDEELNKQKIQAYGPVYLVT